MTLSQSQDDLLHRLNTNRKTGLSRDDATKRREEEGFSNVVEPPINCPAWVCCLLPCIKSIPKMKAFRMIKPEDAEVLRDSQWIQYDASSLVTGDIIRIQEGDLVPADCVVLSVDEGQMLVDSRYVTGHCKPQSCEMDENTGTCEAVQLFLGSKVVVGSGEAVVTAIGPKTKLAELIRDGTFPPKTKNAEEIQFLDPEAGTGQVTRDT